MKKNVFCITLMVFLLSGIAYSGQKNMEKSKDSVGVGLGGLNIVELFIRHEKTLPSGEKRNVLYSPGKTDKKNYQLKSYSRVDLHDPQVVLFTNDSKESAEFQINNGPTHLIERNTQIANIKFEPGEYNIKVFKKEKRKVLQREIPLSIKKEGNAKLVNVSSGTITSYVFH